MRMRTMAGSTAALGLAVGLVALGTTAGGGGAAADDGIGTSTVTTSVLDASLGDLLGLTLLTDVARSTTDPALGAVGATSTFRQLQLTSSITEGLPSLNQVVGEHTASAPVGPADVTTSSLNLDTLALGPVADGTLAPLHLTAANDSSASTSATTEITSMSLLGGLATVTALDSSDRTVSGKAAAEAERVMTLEALSLLDVGRLLQGLGLDALNLPLPVVSDLITSLGIPFDLHGAPSLQALVTSLIDSIAALQDTLDAVITDDLLGAIGGLGLPVALQPALGAAIDTSTLALQQTLANDITTVAGLVEIANLFKVNDLEVTTTAKAADTVDSSVATAAGSIGSVQVGPTVVPGVGPDATAADVTALTNQIHSTLSTVLGPLGFTDLLAVELFQRQTAVSEAAGTVKAESSITGLSVDLTAPSLDAIDAVDDPDGGIGTMIPVIRPNGRVAARGSRAAKAAHQQRLQANAVAANPLAGVLSGGLDGDPLLSQGLQLRVGTVESQSLQSVPAAEPDDSTTTTAAPGSTTTTTAAPGSTTTTTAAPGITTTTTAPATTPTTTRRSTPTTTPGLVPISAPLTPAAQTPGTPTATSTPTGSLPLTGGEQTMWAILALVLSGGALGVRRLRRRVEQ